MNSRDGLPEPEAVTAGFMESPHRLGSNPVATAPGSDIKFESDRMTLPSILVAGIGNIFLGDDAFGCEVVKRLSERCWPDNVHVVDFGIRGFDLAYALLDGYDVTIFVDATPRGDEPGTLYTIEPELDEIENIHGQGAMVETHGMDPMKVLSMVKSMGGQFRKILLVGCEPATFGPEEGQMGLSAPVAAAVEPAATVVASLVNKLCEEAISSRAVCE